LHFCNTRFGYEVLDGITNNARRSLYASYSFAESFRINFRDSYFRWLFIIINKFTAYTQTHDIDWLLKILLLQMKSLKKHTKLFQFSTFLFLKPSTSF
jgi:hypothetical protein